MRFPEYTSTLAINDVCTRSIRDQQAVLDHVQMYRFIQMRAKIFKGFLEAELECF